MNEPERPRSASIPRGGEPGVGPAPLGVGATIPSVERVQLLGAQASVRASAAGGSS